ncbi:pectate lyase [Tautonia rosea]|uniref:pectate lyase n=1 Tax=Tautonia rosea TaxID=2728037 RepID=UPI001474EF73|nr:pectate lyase [Tautonia rosea]
MNLSLWVALTIGQVVSASDRPDPTPAEAEAALHAAVSFFTEKVASHGAYVWRVSSDLTDRRGEGIASPTMAWVQPPGTPSVGEALLDAYLDTDDPLLLDAALDAAHALCLGQMNSGGWFYSIEFDPAKRPAFDYRDNPDRPAKASRSQRMTTLDDDTTQASLRFLIRMDETLDFADPRIHDAVRYGLDALLAAQHPNGGWYVWWDSFPKPLSEDDYPILPACYPETWLREWPNTWLGRYVTNDNLMPDVIETLLLAHRTYDDPRYLTAARRAGDFLILAQMPDPQPAWAQQYNVAMHPEWSRKFEPPAISGGESQGILQVLMRLYRASGDPKYLEPIPKALDYLRRSQLPDGRLARFYELRTNRPLYFTRDYQLTYSSDDMPTHYGFIVPSRLDRIASEYDRLREQPAPRRSSPESISPKLTPTLSRSARAVIDALDDRGAWLDLTEKGTPIIQSATFSENIRVLSRYLAASKAR